MRLLRSLSILISGLLVLSCTGGGTSRLYLKYQPAREFSSLQEKMGLNLAVAPFKDERPEPMYIGYYAPITGQYIYYKSEPYPLEKALTETLSQVLSHRGIKTAPVSGWNGKPDSLKDLDNDSVMMVEIRKFWIEGKTGVLGTDIKSSIVLVFHLGVKKEGKVFTRTMDLERKMKDVRLTPAYAEQTLNQMLTEAFDTYLSNPY